MRRIEMRLDSRHYLPWISEENRQIRRLYWSATWCEIMEALPGRTRGSIKCQAAKLGVRRRCWEVEGNTGQSCIWSPEDQELLRYGMRNGWTVDATATLLGRTVDAVLFRAVNQGLLGRPLVLHELQDIDLDYLDDGPYGDYDAEWAEPPHPWD
ncbi:hypothetical protein LCGC14_1109870 [marine sediment metagenome]|uniref:Uncharacterized protein n=1 Tax=marine sediment metagenome TaxID=412755 RepID=A0A0F9QD85_9ZZZZ